MSINSSTHRSETHRAQVHSEARASTSTKADKSERREPSKSKADAARQRDSFEPAKSTAGKPSLTAPSGGGPVAAAAVAPRANVNDLPGAAQRIADYARTRNIGVPVDNGGGTQAHRWDNVIVQDFSGGSETQGRCSVVDGPQGPHLVRNGFWNKYLEGENHKALGAPLDDEHWDGSGVVQHFEGGTLAWKPDSGVSMQVNGTTGGGAINPSPEFAGAYQPFELTPGVTLGSHVGVHWGPAAGYSNVDRINTAADMLAQRGVGYSTVVVDPNNVQQQAPSIKALLDRGIQPVIRLLPAGSYGDRTMDTLNEADMQQMAKVAAQLKAMGVKVIQLDNEPNLGNKDLMDKINNPARQGEYRDAMARYVANTAHTMDLINQQAPGMSIGFGVLASGPGHTGWDKMWNDVMWGMKAQNDARGGALLQNAWIAVHPYTIGQFNPDGFQSDGVQNAEWMKQNARAILGTNINVLATEGGNPQDQPWQAQVSSDLNVEQLRQTARNPDLTQCFWIVGDDYLMGKNGGQSPGPWEHNALIHVDGSGNPVPTTFFQNMLHIARGEGLQTA